MPKESVGSKINVQINNQAVTELASAGLGYLTKETVALSIPASLDIDDLKIWSLRPPNSGLTMNLLVWFLTYFVWTALSGGWSERHGARA